MSHQVCMSLMIQSRDIFPYWFIHNKSCSHYRQQHESRDSEAMTLSTWGRQCKGRPTFIIRSLTSSALGRLSQPHEMWFCTYRCWSSALVTAAESLWVTHFIPVMQILNVHRTLCGDLCCTLHRHDKGILIMALFEHFIAMKISNNSSFFFFLQSPQAAWACSLFTQAVYGTTKGEACLQVKLIWQTVNTLLSWQMHTTNMWHNFTGHLKTTRAICRRCRPRKRRNYTH